MHLRKMDGRDKAKSAKLPYRKKTDDGKVRHVSIHLHPKKTYRSAKLLKGLFNDIGWSVEDLRRLKLIKRKSGGM